MERLTVKIDKNCYVIDKSKVAFHEKGYSGEAVNRLGLFESLKEDLEKNQEQVTAEMAKLRAENKEKSARFRDLLAMKLTNENMMKLFQIYGL